MPAVSRLTDQASIERGFDFLTDPLFLASSVFVKKMLCRQRHLIE